MKNINNAYINIIKKPKLIYIQKYKNYINQIKNEINKLYQ